MKLKLVVLTMFILLSGTQVHANEGDKVFIPMVLGYGDLPVQLEPTTSPTATFSPTATPTPDPTATPTQTKIIAATPTRTPYIYKTPTQTPTNIPTTTPTQTPTNTPDPLPDWNKIQIIDVFISPDGDPSNDYLLVENKQGLQVDLKDWIFAVTNYKSAGYTAIGLHSGDHTYIRPWEVVTVCQQYRYGCDFWVSMPIREYPCTSLHSPEWIEVSRYCWVFPQVDIIDVDPGLGTVTLKNKIAIQNPVLNHHVWVDNYGYRLPFTVMNGYWEYTYAGFTLPPTGCLELTDDLNYTLSMYCY